MSRRTKPAAKQSDRNATKKAAKQATKDEDEGGPEADNKIFGLAKSLILGSVAVGYTPKLQTLIQQAVNEVKGGAKKEEEKEEDEKKDTDDSADADKAEAPPKSHGFGGSFMSAKPKPAPSAEDESENKDETENKEEEASGENGKTENGSKEDSSGGPQQMFESLSLRLAWHNCLGLAAPSSGEASKKAWLEMKGLELDYGPRAKRRGNPVADRLLANLTNNLPQYLHILLALITLRSFLFRSYFACLPWLIFYQFASLMIPLDKIPQVPALPLDKVDIKFRVAITVGLNILVWFFFLFEIVWRIWWLEIILYTSIIMGHAYVVRPEDK